MLNLPVKKVLLLVLIHRACVQTVIHLFVSVVERCVSVERISKIYTCSSWVSLARIRALGFLRKASRRSLLSFIRLNLRFV